MSLPEELYSALTTRAATDHESAKLMELIAKVDEALAEPIHFSGIMDTVTLAATQPMTWNAYS
jgi:hypothetical protein